jgi:hypothetical protein
MASTMLRVTRVPSHPVWPKASCTLHGTDTLDAHLDYFRIVDKPAVITSGSSTSWNDQSSSEKLIIVALPPTLVQDVIQPVEYDLVRKALVVYSAVSLPTLLRGDDVLRLGTGQLVVKLLTVNSQLSLALSADIEIRAGELVLQTPQVVLAQPVDEFCDRSAARTMSITYVSLGDKSARHGRQIDFALKISGARLIRR